jgi:DNA-binding protein H-NS
MNPIESSSALQKISKIINQLKRDEAVQLMNIHGETVNKIKELMIESGITSEQLHTLLNTKTPKVKSEVRTIKKYKKKSENNPSYVPTTEMV